MNKTLTTLLLTLLLLSTTLTAKTQAILKLDTLGHTGMIKDIVVTKSGDIISASEDKTIRVWSSQTGREKRKILGQIGSGSGEIFAIALSSDERYLAVGGFLDKNGGIDVGTIRIYNYQTGKLLQLLKSHTNVVFDLAFSKDARFLISGSGDTTAKIWSVEKDFQLKDTIKFHTNSVYGVKIIQKNGKHFALTAGFDKKIALYDMQKREVIKSDSSNYKLSYLATNSSLQQIAVCGEGEEIDIYDFSLHLLKRIKSETVPSGLHYSRDGRFLIAGFAFQSKKPTDVINVYKAYKNYVLYRRFTKHTNVTAAVNFIERGNKIVAVSGGGNNKEIYVWDFRNKIPKVLHKIVGAGQSIWSIGIKGNSVAWGNGSTYRNKLQKSINLKTFSIQNVKSNTHNFHRISTTNGSYTLSPSKGGDYGLDDAVLNIKQNGMLKAKIVKTDYDGYRHNCYGWYKDYIVSGGTNGQLKIYNKIGREIASLVGHTGEVWSIAIDGDRLVSGSDDQTIKVWDLSGVNDSIEYDEDYIQNIMNKYNIVREGVLVAAKEMNDNAIYKMQKIKPIFNIFVSKENDYIIWSKSGYFTSSVGGDKYVGYHINQGANKEARYVGSDKYFDTLYRPDIIEAIWQTGSEKKAIIYANRTKKVKSVDVATSLPPVVTLLSRSDIKTTQKTIEIRYSVESKEPLTKTVITLNGKTISKRALQLKRKKDGVKSVTIELEDGENIISIKVRNRFAFSDEVIVSVFKTSQTKNIYKPTLYLLSVGISHYKDPEYNLEVANKDAISIAKMMQKQEHKIYKKVVTKVLTNADATSDDIFDGLDWIEREATSRDVVIIFIAGHGVNDEKGNYYFLPYNTNLKHLRRTAVKWSEIEDTISNLPSKVILLADTCHSGNITGNRRDITSAVKSIINSGSGSIIMTATTGSGYSYEQSNWGHGAFTKALLEGIGKLKADYNHDGTISIKEIDLYITSRVKQLTDGKQKPTTIIPNSVPDFAIGVR